jgi:hypothetical protein
MVWGRGGVGGGCINVRAAVEAAELGGAAAPAHQLAPMLGFGAALPLHKDWQARAQESRAPGILREVS